MRERLFESMVSVRGDAQRNGATPHLGLGLYIVRLIAQLHGGSARADNRADGSGVVVTRDVAGCLGLTCGRGERRLTTPLRAARLVATCLDRHPRPPAPVIRSRGSSRWLAPRGARRPT